MNVKLAVRKWAWGKYPLNTDILTFKYHKSIEFILLKMTWKTQFVFYFSAREIRDEMELNYYTILYNN